ncbi:hypothetical protein [Novosphingobium lindaniclasticum]
MFSAFRSWLHSLTSKETKQPENASSGQLMSPDGDPIIHVHEDDWGMRNIFPLTVQKEVAKDLDASIQSGEKNRAPAGIGWTAVHMIEEPSTSYVETGLRIAELAKLLVKFMPRVKHFYATTLGAIGSSDRYPFGAYEEEAWCFGFNAQCYLKIDTEGEYVKAIWFDISTADPNKIDALRGSMEAINALIPSFIGDYFMGAEVPIADSHLLDCYFSERNAQMAAVDKFLAEQAEKRSRS